MLNGHISNNEPGRESCWDSQLVTCRAESNNTLQGNTHISHWQYGSPSSAAHVLQVLYPSVAEHFGSAAADKLVEEHQELKNTLYELDGITDPNSPILDELVQKTIKV